MNYIDREFISLSAIYLPRFKWVGEDVANFRCPFCGDSKKSKIKARGYLYSVGGSVRFKCHNCGRGMSLKEFIRHIAPSVYEDYMLRAFKLPAKKPIIENTPKVSDSDRQQKFRIHYALQKYTKPLATHRDCLRYIQKRNLLGMLSNDLLATDDANALISEIKGSCNPYIQGPAVVIKITNENNELTGIQCRMLSQSEYAPRYMNLRFTEEPSIWGVKRIYDRQNILVFEGAFDAMTVPNAIALNGAMKKGALEYVSSKYGIDNIIICYDNDFRTNPEVLRRVKDAVKKGYRVVLMDESFGYKDVNEAAQNGVSVDDIVSYIKRRTFRGLKATLELARIIR